MDLNQDLHTDSLNDSRASLNLGQRSPKRKLTKGTNRLKSQHGTPLQERKKFGRRTYHNSFQREDSAPNTCIRNQRPKTANYKSKRKRNEDAHFKEAYDFSATDPK